MVDLQTLVDTLAGLDEDSVITVITSVLQARPELAPPVVTFAVPDLTYPPQKALVERRSQGIIKSFSEQKGFGFIQCEELHSVFGNDVFLHHSQLAGYQPGQPVSFAVVLNKDNKPQAYDLQMVDPSFGKGCKAGFKGGFKGWGPQDWGSQDMNGGDKGMAMMAKGDKGMGKDMTAMYMMKGGGKGMGKDKGGKGKDKGCGKSAGQPNEVTPLGSFPGVIKSFNPNNGYGFIDCPELKTLYFHDVFLHHQQLGEFGVGDHVEFTAYLNNSGKPQGKDLRPQDPGNLAKRQRTFGEFGAGM